MTPRLVACLFACSLLLSCKSQSPEEVDQPPSSQSEEPSGTVEVSSPAPASIEQASKEEGDHPALRDYVGLRVPPGPEYLQSRGAILVSGGDGQTGLAVEHFQDGDVSMLWLKHMLHRDERGIPHWEVVAVQRFATPAKGETVVLGSCNEGASADSGMGGTFAIVRNEDAEWLTDVRQAWRLDMENKRFVELPPTNQVRCINDGWGI